MTMLPFDSFACVNYRDKVFYVIFVTSAIYHKHRDTVISYMLETEHTLYYRAYFLAWTAHVRNRQE